MLRRGNCDLGRCRHLAKVPQKDCMLVGQPPNPAFCGFEVLGGCTQQVCSVPISTPPLPSSPPLAHEFAHEELWC